MNVYSEDEFTPSALWNYALDIYHEKLISEACLTLQDHYGIDVNLLLFCLWSGAEGRKALSAAELSSAVEISTNWQSSIVEPLRHVRRALKIPTSLADKRQAEELRRVVAKSELYAERMELQMLGQLTLRFASNPENKEACALNAAENLATYIKGMTKELSKEHKRDLLTLWQCSFPQADSAVLIKKLSAF